MPKYFSDEELSEAQVEEIAEALEEALDTGVMPAEWFNYIPAPKFRGYGGTPRALTAADQVTEQAVRALRDRRSDSGGIVGMVTSLIGRVQANRPVSDWELEFHKVTALLIEAMVELGGVRLLLRYDGGHDEGFAWLEHCELADGTRLDSTQLQARIEQTQAFARIRTLMPDIPLEELLEIEACTFWIGLLLGEGFGTGSYFIYGSAVLDLATGEVKDVPQPDPVTRNFTLAGV